LGQRGDGSNKGKLYIAMIVDDLAVTGQCEVETLAVINKFWILSKVPIRGRSPGIMVSSSHGCMVNRQLYCHKLHILKPFSHVLKERQTSCMVCNCQ
jgi:hypothetical protein